MKLLRFTSFAAVLITGLYSATAQGFVNLGFENTTITTVSFPGGDRYTATIPGWSWNTFNYVNGDPNSVGLNELAISAPATTLHGLNSPFFPAILGSYSVLLQGGDTSGSMIYGTNGASIFQTASIPVTSQSLIFAGGSSLQVRFNGQILTPIALSNAPSYTIWGADISAYAGQSGELRFTAPWRSASILDGVQFSPTPVPEPSALMLSGLFIVCLLVFLKRPPE